MRLRAFAKINLDLRILGVRPDGYHDISTVFQAVSVHDTLTVDSRAGPLTVTCDDDRVPVGEGNLAARAVRAMWRECDRPGGASGVRVHIEKRVPVAAGLGGGSADAAAVIMGLARLWDLPDSDPRLARAAASVGADVPFFLVGGTALGTGRGDVLVPLDDATPLDVVIVKPPFGVATVEAYRWFDELFGAVNRGPVAASIREGRVLSGCRNQLERAVAIRQPEISELCAALPRNGRPAGAHVGKRVGGVRPVRPCGRRLMRPGVRARAGPALTGHSGRRLSAGPFRGLPEGVPPRILREAVRRGRIQAPQESPRAWT